MQKTKALVVGVSQYFDPQTPDLPFCKYDISLIRDALYHGLKLDYEDIITLGATEVVTAKDFFDVLDDLSNFIKKEDNLIFYFSGHGSNSNEELAFACCHLMRLNC